MVRQSTSKENAAYRVAVRRRVPDSLRHNPDSEHFRIDFLPTQYYGPYDRLSSARARATILRGGKNRPQPEDRIIWLEKTKNWEKIHD